MEKAPIHTTATNTDAEAIMAEFIQKFGSKEDAMSFLSRFSSSLGTEKASTGAATAAPPPPTIPEDSTTQPSSSQAIDTQTSIGAHVETGQNPGAEEGLEHADDGGLAKILESMAVAEPRTEMAAVEISEGETPGKIVEGETPVEEIAEGETPVEKTTEGETPDQTGDETPGSVRGETPEPTEGGDPRRVFGGKDTRQDCRTDARRRRATSYCRPGGGPGGRRTTG